MPRIVPNLWFDTQALEAAEFYCSIFPNSRILSVARYPEGAPGPAGEVMTVEYELDGQRCVHIDGGPQFTFSEAVSFQIDCADQAEVDHYWTRWSTAARSRSAAGSRTGTASPGRSSPPAWTSSSATPTRAGRSGRCRPCCGCASSTWPRCAGPRTRCPPEPGTTEPQVADLGLRRWWAILGSNQ